MCDSRNPRNGATIATLGHYAPYKLNKPLLVDLEVYQEWVSKGAKPTDAVRKLVNQFKKRGETVQVKEPVKKPPTKAEAPPIEETPAEEEPAAEDTATEAVETE